MGLRARQLVLAFHCLVIFEAVAHSNTLAVEQGGDGDAQLVLRDDQGQEVEAIPLITVKQGTRYYHWTSKNDVISLWSHDGKVTSEEMAKRLPSRSGYNGGGVYTSLDSLDSHDYGNHVMVFTAERDLYVLPHNSLNKFCEAAKSAGKMQGGCSYDSPDHKTALIASGVQGITDYGHPTNRYYVWFDPIALKQVREGNISDVLLGTKNTSLLKVTQIAPYVDRSVTFDAATHDLSALNAIRAGSLTQYLGEILKGVASADTFVARITQALQQEYDHRRVSLSLEVPVPGKPGDLRLVHVKNPTEPAERLFLEEQPQKQPLFLWASNDEKTASWIKAQTLSAEAWAPLKNGQSLVVSRDSLNTIHAGRQLVEIEMTKKLRILPEDSFKKICAQVPYLDDLSLSLNDIAHCARSPKIKTLLNSLGVQAIRDNNGVTLQLIDDTVTTKVRAGNSEDILTYGKALPSGLVEKLNFLESLKPEVPLVPGSQLAKVSSAVNKALLKTTLSAQDRTELENILAQTTPQLADGDLRKLIELTLHPSAPTSTDTEKTESGAHQ